MSKRVPCISGAGDARAKGSESRLLWRAVGSSFLPLSLLRRRARSRVVRQSSLSADPSQLSLADNRSLVRSAFLRSTPRASYRPSLGPTPRPACPCPLRSTPPSGLSELDLSLSQNGQSVSKQGAQFEHNPTGWRAKHRVIAAPAPVAWRIEDQSAASASCARRRLACAGPCLCGSIGMAPASSSSRRQRLTVMGWTRNHLTNAACG
jgi:hypothetical protein